MLRLLALAATLATCAACGEPRCPSPCFIIGPPPTSCFCPMEAGADAAPE